MRRFTRYFSSLAWKIFLSIWLTSLVVVLVTAFVMGQIVEREKHQEVLAAKALGFAEVLVERYERGGSFEYRGKPYQRKRFNSDDDDDQRHQDEHDSRETKERVRQLAPFAKIRIYKGREHQQIFGPKRPLGREKTGSLVLSLQSERGNYYKVVVDLNPRKSLYWSIFRFMLSLQMVIIIVASALASLWLTWIVIKPIKRLRQHTEELYLGNFAVRTDSRLACRRDEIGELAREFNRMADHVEQALNANQRLLQDVSHELRAPLARLQMAAGLVEQRLGEADQQLVMRINLECERLSRLIDEILSLARLESQSGEAQAFALQPLLTQLVEDCCFAAPEHQIIWQADARNIQIFGQTELLRRAVDNVLGNAVKHTPDGSEIRLTLELSAQRCQICIVDNGPGVDEDQLERLFDPFYRQQAVNNGYGLGLSIARRAVELLGGRVTASSAAGEGLSVCIDLPCKN